MGTFHIKSTDIDDTMWEISGKFEELMLHCSYYKEYINTFVAQQAFTGGGADAMKTYLTEVHGLLTDTVVMTAQGILDKFIQYQQGYRYIGEPEKYSFPQEVLESAKTTYDGYGTSLEYECERVRTALTNLSGIYSLGAPDITTIQNHHQTLSSEISTLVTNISTHESNTKTYSLVDLENMIIALKQSVETWASQGRTPIDQYEPGSISLESSTQILALAATPVIYFRQQNGEQLETAWATEEYYTFTLPQQRETQGVWQAIGGVVLVVVGVTCIVATAGAATPLVIAGAVAGGGTVLFGGAEIIEGGQNAYYGSIGDMNSAAFNPIRDTVFLGNQGVYDNTKNVFVFAAGAMIPIGSAYTAGTLTLRSGSVIVAEELLSEGAGFAVSKAGEAMDLNPTATMLLSIAASMGTSAGLGKLDQAYNISGSFPKVDVTTTNPANMIDNIDGVPASTGIDVPGSKVDDAVEGIGESGTKALSEMSDAELGELGYKRYCDGSIRDSLGHFVGNSGTIPGVPGVDAAEKYLANADYTINGREISVRGADGTLRRYDIVATSPDGTIIGIEVKSGSATRTAQQIALDNELMASGGLNTVGQKAIDASISRISDVQVIHVSKDGIVTTE